MSARPARVSVVMAVHNGERHLREAVDSILGQTFRDFEFIIIDDASTDGTPGILTDYARRDQRIRLLRNETNLGPYPSGNRGLETARAPIIARMDADDISAPERLARQLAFLDANPDHLLVTTSYRAIDDAGRTLYVKRKAADDFAVRWLMRFRMCLEHPSACFRATLPDGTAVRYDESFAVAQDFELFTRIMAAGKAAILPEVLFHYRLHPTNISSTRRQEQKSNVFRIASQFQARELSADLAGQFTDLLQCYLLGQRATPSKIRNSVRALDQMLADDLAARPAARLWLRRQSAEILADAMLRRGGGNLRVMAAFVLYARGYLWPLFWRVMENAGYLPRWLESFPDPDGR